MKQFTDEQVMKETKAICDAMSTLTMLSKEAYKANPERVNAHVDRVANEIANSDIREHFLTIVELCFKS